MGQRIEQGTRRPLRYLRGVGIGVKRGAAIDGSCRQLHLGAVNTRVQPSQKRVHANRASRRPSPQQGAGLRGTSAKVPRSLYTHFIAADLEPTGYIPSLSQTLEQQVEGLEKKLADLTAQFRDVPPGTKDWRRTSGLSHDDPGFEEMVQLGREYRHNVGRQDPGANS